MNDFLLQAFIYLAAGVAAAPIASRLGLGSVLGYLIAGVAIGPVLGVVGAETQDLQHFAEFGVVMMLFLIGLELDARELWSMRARLAGLGGMQIGGTIAVIAAAAMAFGVDWRMALATGAILSLSSTAIVLQTLGEKGLMKSEGGESSFSVLLVQDIAVIPMLALLPLLASPELLADVDLGGAHGDGGHGDDHGEDGHGGHGDGGHGGSLIGGWPAWAQTLATLGAVGAVVFGGRFLVQPLFRFIAASRLREIFTAAALLIVVAISVLMGLVGLSPALGAFVAGVVLASSEFRHELESDIEPFKGLLLGLFFITVGAGVDFGLLFENAALIVGLTVSMMAAKAAILYGIARVYALPRRDAWLFTLGLPQAGEFGFVLISFAVGAAVLPLDMAAMLSLIVALSMLLTPVLFIIHERLFSGAAETADDEREPDAIDQTGAVIIAGLGRFGQIVNRLLLSNGCRTVVLDHRASLVENMRKFGVRSFYGDAARPDLLQSAGLDEASALVVAIDDREASLQIVEFARRVRPDIKIIARAFDRHHVYSLHRAGADETVRETFDSSLRAGKLALASIGRHPFEIEAAARAYSDFDRHTLKLLSAVWDPEKPIMENADYLRVATAREAEIERAMRGDRGVFSDEARRAWSPPSERDAGET